MQQRNKKKQSRERFLAKGGEWIMPLPAGKRDAWKQPSERLEPLVIPCLSLVPFLSLLVCSLLLEEVEAAIRKTKKHFN